MARSVTQPDDTTVRLVGDLLAAARSRGASDLHFDPDENGLRVRVRVDGLLEDVERVPADLGDNVIGRLKVLGGLLTYRVDIPQEGAFALSALQGMAAGDARLATFPTIRGERAVVRMLIGQDQAGTRQLSELGFTSAMRGVLESAAQRAHGLVLITGPAGSGKSTTLYALARHSLVAAPGRSVVSLEDPVEQRVPGLTQIQIQPHGELDYVRAMRSLLRQDVEALLIGEIRDAQTAHVVIEAAMTGHLLMSTLHSGDPAEALARLLEMGLPAYQVVGAVTLIVAQRLVRTVCSSCQGQGCLECSASGYRGRTVIAQTVTLDDSLRAAVLRQAPLAELRRVIAERGADLAADGLRLVHSGRTTRDEIQRVLGAAMPKIHGPIESQE
jgi:type II secretory ATPase GspE/PulE/Tfp pilus assembly ATPase PilB-like protein